MASVSLRKKKTLTREDHEEIQRECQIQGDEDYAVVWQKGKGIGGWAVHVFQRQPSLPEIQKYEDTASRLEFKGNKARIEGSQIEAANMLYTRLVSRAFHVIVGLKVHDRLDRDAALRVVPPLMKRVAIQELVGNIIGASRMEEDEGDEKPELDDDDLEGHSTFPALVASGQRSEPS